MEIIHNPKLIESYIEQRGIRDLFSIPLPVFRLRRYSPGELLTNPFSPSNMLQFVVEGELLLYDMPDESSTVMIRTVYNGVRLLGDMELLDAEFRPFFVEARTDVYTLEFRLDRYREALLGDPVFLLYVARTLAGKLNGAAKSAASMPLRSRVALSIQHMDARREIRDIAQLADMLNVSSRQLLRVLKGFCEEGVLEHTGKGVYRLIKKPEI